MSTVIVIPARYDSKRFPGKPLTEIAGKSLLRRVWEIANSIESADVFVATDDQRILDHATAFGAKVVCVDALCENGTERVELALRKLLLRPEIVINLQGDAVLTPPWIIEAVVSAMQKDASIAMATAATRLTWEQCDYLCTQKSSNKMGGTFVVCDSRGKALYFSKAMIPYIRFKSGSCPIFRHIGLYGYRYDTLVKYLTLPPGPLEQAEGLEQLRALENGIDIHVAIVDYHGRTHASVDSPEDVARVEQIIAHEGELLAPAHHMR